MLWFPPCSFQVATEPNKKENNKRMRSGRAPGFLWGIAVAAIALLVWFEVMSTPKEPPLPSPEHAAAAPKKPAPAVALDTMAPTIGTLSTLTGNQVSVENLRGKIVILDFWATWCGPCRMLFPLLKDIHKKYAESGVVVIGITDESSALVNPFVKKMGLNYQIVADPKTPEIRGRSYKIRSLPTMVIIDRTGKVRSYETGFDPTPGDGTKEHLDALVPQLIAEK